MIAQSKRSTLNSPGLNSSINTLQETMLPDISPDLVAEAAVQVNGGYDGRFGVSLPTLFVHTSLNMRSAHV